MKIFSNQNQNENENQNENQNRKNNCQQKWAIIFQKHKNLCIRFWFSFWFHKFNTNIFIPTPETETQNQKPKPPNLVNRQNDTSIQSHSGIPIPHRFSHIIFYDPLAILSSPKSAFFGQTCH